MNSRSIKLLKSGECVSDMSVSNLTEERYGSYLRGSGGERKLQTFPLIFSFTYQLVSREGTYSVHLLYVVMSEMLVKMQKSVKAFKKTCMSCF